MIRGVLQPVLFTAGIVVTAAVVVVNPSIPDLPDIAVPALFAPAPERHTDPAAGVAAVPDVGRAAADAAPSAVPAGAVRSPLPAAPYVSIPVISVIPDGPAAVPAAVPAIPAAPELPAAEPDRDLAIPATALAESRIGATPSEPRGAVLPAAPGPSGRTDGSPKTFPASRQRPAGPPPFAGPHTPSAAAAQPAPPPGAEPPGPPPGPHAEGPGPSDAQRPARPPGRQH